MDTIVPFDNVVDCLRNPPSVHPCPDFTKLHALRLHLTKALKFFECPQSALHGWSGRVMAPAVYALLEPVPFFVPTDPGAAPVYTPFATPAAIKMIDATFKEDKNYFIAAINQSIVPAFNQVVQNQNVLQHQIAVMSLNQTPPLQAPPAYVQPPVQQVAFPMPQSYQPRMQQQPSHLTNAYGWASRTSPMADRVEDAAVDREDAGKEEEVEDAHDAQHLLR